MTVLIVDYGMGNLRSVQRAFEECGARAAISSSPADILGAAAVVIPGVGAFAEGMQHLESRGLAVALRTAAVEHRVPILGICLGMQLLANRGHEVRPTAGLGLIPGEVRVLEPRMGERLPHVGWNELHFREQTPALFTGIQNQTDFYFVHSFHFIPENDAAIVARTPYAGGFASAVQQGNLWGVQFHPEKSSRAGFQLLRNFLRLARRN